LALPYLIEMIRRAVPRGVHTSTTSLPRRDPAEMNLGSP
jgi:hypothetical protein